MHFLVINKSIMHVYCVKLRLTATCEVRTRMSLESSCVLAFVIENDSVSMCPSRRRLIARLYTSLGASKMAWMLCCVTCNFWKKSITTSASLVTEFATGVNGVAVKY